MTIPPHEWFPVEPALHEAQLAALTGLIARGALVLDIGCGDGRVARPLAAMGCRVVAVDSNKDALERCGRGGSTITTRHADFLDPAANLNADVPYDAIVCVGHTLMLVHEPRAAAGLFKRLGELTSPSGVLYVDDFSPLWADVAEGNWQTGVAEDGSMQLIWVPGDNVLALRHGEDVDESVWSVRKRDRLHRLWSLGELSLLAMHTGWAPPQVRSDDGLIAFSRAS